MLSHDDRSSLVKLQLRDFHGRWIKMGFHVKWKDADGSDHMGTVTGITHDFGMGPTARAKIREYDKFGKDLGTTVNMDPKKLQVINSVATLHFDDHGHAVAEDPNTHRVGMGGIGSYNLSDKEEGAHPVLQKLDLPVGTQLYPLSVGSLNKSPYNTGKITPSANIAKSSKTGLATIVKNRVDQPWVIVKDANGKEYAVSKQHFGVVRTAHRDEALIKASDSEHFSKGWIQDLKQDHADISHTGEPAPHAEEHTPKPKPEAHLTAEQSKGTKEITLKNSDHSPVKEPAENLQIGDQVYPVSNSYGQNQYGTHGAQGDDVAKIDPMNQHGIGTVKAIKSNGDRKIQTSSGSIYTLHPDNYIVKRDPQKDSAISGAHEGYADNVHPSRQWVNQLAGGKKPAETEHLPTPTEPKDDKPTYTQLPDTSFGNTDYHTTTEKVTPETLTALHTGDVVSLPTKNGVPPINVVKNSDGSFSFFSGQEFKGTKPQSFIEIGIGRVSTARVSRKAAPFEPHTEAPHLDEHAPEPFPKSAQGKNIGDVHGIENAPVGTRITRADGSGLERATDGWRQIGSDGAPILGDNGEPHLYGNQMVKNLAEGPQKDSYKATFPKEAFSKKDIAKLPKAEEPKASEAPKLTGPIKTGTPDPTKGLSAAEAAKELDAHFVDGTPEERRAVNLYLAGNDVNRQLRAGNADDYHAKLASDLNSFIDKQKPLEKPIVIYRGQSAGFADPKPGDTVHEPGFLSTSLDSESASKFAGDGNMIYEIHTSPGDKVLPVSLATARDQSDIPEEHRAPVSSLDHEGETLLPSGTSLKVASVENRTVHGQNVKYVTATTVPHETPKAEAPSDKALAPNPDAKELERYYAGPNMHISSAEENHFGDHVAPFAYDKNTTDPKAYFKVGDRIVTPKGDATITGFNKYDNYHSHPIVIKRDIPTKGSFGRNGAASEDIGPRAIMEAYRPIPGKAAPVDNHGFDESKFGKVAVKKPSDLKPGDVVQANEGVKLRVENAEPHPTKPDHTNISYKVAEGTYAKGVKPGSKWGTETHSNQSTVKAWSPKSEEHAPKAEDVSAPEAPAAEEHTPESPATHNQPMADLEKQAKANGETVLYHGGLPEGTTLDGIDLNRNGEQQNKRGRSFGGFYLTDDSSKSWSEDYAAKRNGVMHGFAIDKNARIDDRGSQQIDRLSAEDRAEAAKHADIIKGKDLLGRTQYVLLNKDVVKGVGETNIKGEHAPEAPHEAPKAEEPAPEAPKAEEPKAETPAPKDIWEKIPATAKYNRPIEIHNFQLDRASNLPEGSVISVGGGRTILVHNGNGHFSKFDGSTKAFQGAGKITNGDKTLSKVKIWTPPRTGAPHDHLKEPTEAPAVEHHVAKDMHTSSELDNVFGGHVEPFEFDKNAQDPKEYFKPGDKIVLSNGNKATVTGFDGKFIEYTRDNPSAGGFKKDGHTNGNVSTQGIKDAYRIKEGQTEPLNTHGFDASKFEKPGYTKASDLKPGDVVQANSAVKARVTKVEPVEGHPNSTKVHYEVAEGTYAKGLKPGDNWGYEHHNNGDQLMTWHPKTGEEAAKASAPHVADRLNVKAAKPEKLSDEELHAADKEFERRADALGYHGTVSKTHQNVKDEIAKRGIAEAPAKAEEPKPEKANAPSAPEEHAEVKAVPKAQLEKLDTKALIEQYNLATSNYKGRFTNTSPGQKRIDHIVDLMSERADKNDPEAVKWYDDAAKADEARREALAAQKAIVPEKVPDGYNKVEGLSSPHRSQMRIGDKIQLKDGRVVDFTGNKSLDAKGNFVSSGIGIKDSHGNEDTVKTADVKDIYRPDSHVIQSDAEHPFGDGYKPVPFDTMKGNNANFQKGDKVVLRNGKTGTVGYVKYDRMLVDKDTPDAKNGESDVAVVTGNDIKGLYRADKSAKTEAPKTEAPKAPEPKTELPTPKDAASSPYLQHPNTPLQPNVPVGGDNFRPDVMGKDLTADKLDAMPQGSMIRDVYGTDSNRMFFKNADGTWSAYHIEGNKAIFDQTSSSKDLQLPGKYSVTTALHSMVKADPEDSPLTKDYEPVAYDKYGWAGDHLKVGDKIVLRDGTVENVEGFQGHNIVYSHDADGRPIATTPARIKGAYRLKSGEPAASEPKAPEAPKPAAPKAAMTENPYGSTPIHDNGKVVTDSKGNELRAGQIVTHNKGKGRGVVTKVLPKGNGKHSARVQFEDGTQTTVQTHLLSAADSHEEKSSVPDNIGAGAIHHDSTTNKMHIGDRNGVPLKSGDRVTYTDKSGETKSGTVKGIYKGKTNLAAIQFDDGTLQRKAGTAITKEDAAHPAHSEPKVEAPKAEEPKHEPQAPAAPEPTPAVEETKAEEPAYTPGNPDYAPKSFGSKSKDSHPYGADYATDYLTEGDTQKFPVGTTIQSADPEDNLFGFNYTKVAPNAWYGNDTAIGDRDPRYMDDFDMSQTNGHEQHIFLHDNPQNPAKEYTPAIIKEHADKQAKAARPSLDPKPAPEEPKAEAPAAPEAPASDPTTDNPADLADPVAPAGIEQPTDEPASAAHEYTYENTGHMTDGDLMHLLTHLYETDPAAAEQVENIINEREDRGVPFTKDSFLTKDSFKVDHNPETNPTERPERKLTTHQKVAEEYDKYAMAQYGKAENDLNGVLLNEAGKEAAKNNPELSIDIFRGPWQVANKYASEELQQWWKDNGRETLASYRYGRYNMPTDRKAWENVKLRGHSRGALRSTSDRSQQ